MGTTADKLQKLVEGKQAIVNAVNSKANTSLSINSKLSDIANAISDITSGGGIDTSSATATADDILKGKTAYTAGGKVEGTIETYNGSMSGGAEQIGSSCEPTGLPLEVDSLPIGGTAVPNSGMVEKVYFNTALSEEEVKNILSQLTYIDGTSYSILFSSDMLKVIMVIKSEDEYMIIGANETYYFISSQGGWQGTSELEIGLEVMSDLDGMSIGTQNELIKNLVSTTPFSAGVEGAIYKTPSKFVDLFIASDYGFGPLSETYNIVGCEEVETLPTSNIISSTMESFYLYYAKSENDIFVYIDVGNGPMWLNAGLLAQHVVGLTLTFKGTGVYKGDFIEDGYYAQYSGDKYYICLNGKFVKIENEQKTVEKFINEERFDRLEINYTTDNNLNLGGKFEDFKGDYIKINVTPYCFWDGVFELGSYVFADATVKTVYFNALCEGALEIDDTTFVDATNLEKVILNFTDFKEIINDSNNYNGFKNTPIANGTGYIYVPDNKVDYVKSLGGWSTYASQIRPLSEYVE